MFDVCAVDVDGRQLLGTVTGIAERTGLDASLLSSFTVVTPNIDLEKETNLTDFSTWTSL